MVDGWVDELIDGWVELETDERVDRMGVWIEGQR